MGEIIYDGSSVNTRWYQFKEGRIMRKVKDGEPVFCSALGGRLKSIKVTDEEWQGERYKKVSVTLFDSDQINYVLSMRFGSGYCSAFCKILPNVKLDLPLEISGKSEQGTDASHTKTSIFIKQEGQAVKWFFTKANAHGLPEAERFYNKRTEKDEWVFKEQNDFLLQVLSYYSFCLANRPDEDFKKLDLLPDIYFPLVKGGGDPVLTNSDINVAAGDHLGPVDDLPF